jgi:hypothetical protein
MDENQTPTDNTEAQPEVSQQSPAQPELSINDLQNLRAIVDTASRRGAFQAQEMSAIGSVYDRLSTFLNAVAPKQPEQAAEKPAEADQAAE